MRSYNRFLLFLSSCIPGCGEMYLGYMKRGLSLLLAAACISMFSFSILFDSFMIFLAVVWLYAFFDTYNLYHRILDGSAESDAYLFRIPSWTNLSPANRRMLGWGLLVVGLYLGYFSIVFALLPDLIDHYWYYDNLFTSYIPRIFISLLLIGFGVRFIRGPKEKAPLEDDFIPPKPDHFQHSDDHAES